MMSLFCKHSYNSIAKEEYNWDEPQIVKGTEHWFTPKFEKHNISETVEILLCNKCGKTKKIRY